MKTNTENRRGRTTRASNSTLMRGKRDKIKRHRVRREAEKKRGCRVAKDRIGIISFKIFSLTNLLARIKWMASKLFRKKTLRLMKEERQRRRDAGEKRRRGEERRDKS